MILMTVPRVGLFNSLCILLFIPCCFLFIHTTRAQEYIRTGPELIFNGNFEQYDTCPPGVSGTIPPMFESYIQYATGWSNPTFNTPDYFNACAPLFAPLPFILYGASVSQNFWGNQMPHSGDGYAGFGFSAGGIGGEYIQIRLLDKLAPGKLYCISYYLSLADSQDYAGNKIGCSFRTSQAFYSFLGQISDSNVLFTSGPSIISERTGWWHIEGNFRPDSAYEWMMIGRFGTLGPNDTLRMETPLVPRQGGVVYYYIDDVSLYECEASPRFPNVITPNGDGLNDVFKSESDVTMDKISIFNRWGEVVFNAQSASSWDGKMEGTVASDGVYFYRIIVKNKEYKGYIELIR